ncbi:MAG: phosphoglycerate mutase [Frankiales bacterium]|nr:phosphoglycerate mutase [Frankiales bacterium]
MELVLVRHALPVRIDSTPDGSPADPGLSASGHEQATRVVEALRGEDITVLYSSPARRALETGAPLAAALGLELVLEPGLAEFDVAHSSYVPVEELRAAGDPRWERLAAGDLYHPDVDPVAFREGVIAGVERIAGRHPGGRAVLFTHSGTINAYTAHVTGQSSILWFAPAYASISRVGARRDGRRGIVSLNETAHVRDLLGR